VDYYRILQVSRHAEPEVIEKAYKTLSLKYHPDMVHAAEQERATRHMQHINEAYRVLKDPVSRRRYDASLPAEKPGRTAWDVFMDKGLVGMLLDKVGYRE
jgi:molecular chaperone DnaJ